MISSELNGLLRRYAGTEDSRWQPSATDLLAGLPLEVAKATSIYSPRSQRDVSEAEGPLITHMRPFVLNLEDATAEGAALHVNQPLELKFSKAVDSKTYGIAAICGQRQVELSELNFEGQTVSLLVNGIPRDVWEPMRRQQASSTGGGGGGDASSKTGGGNHLMDTNKSWSCQPAICGVISLVGAEASPAGENVAVVLPLSIEIICFRRDGGCSSGSSSSWISDAPHPLLILPQSAARELDQYLSRLLDQHQEQPAGRNEREECTSPSCQRADSYDGASKQQVQSSVSALLIDLDFCLSLMKGSSSGVVLDYDDPLQVEWAVKVVESMAGQLLQRRLYEVSCC